MNDVRFLINKIKHREDITQDDLTWFAKGLADGSITDAQAGAFAMGVCLNGLGDSGPAFLTLAMRDSGDILKWDVDKPVLDKHSTGGIGDCVSLILAPALAACGACVPMISGRGLGHSGGTLDKLESIPGISTEMSEEDFRHIVSKAGFAIVSANKKIAPADRRLYAIRDVTSTIDSVELASASILSKKLAAGLEGLVLDVKAGSGAFMKDIKNARALARALVDTANKAGCPTTAFITDMSQPLAPSMGNALEIAEIMQVLSGDKNGPLLDLSVELGGELLFNGGLAVDAKTGQEQILSSIVDGRAMESFGMMIDAYKGPKNFIERWENLLPKKDAPVVREVKAKSDGYVHSMDGEALGMVVVELGGGRKVQDDIINPAVGLSDIVPIGTKLSKGDVLCFVYAANEDDVERAIHDIENIIIISENKPDQPQLILEYIVSK